MRRDRVEAQLRAFVATYGCGPAELAQRQAAAAEFEVVAAAERRRAEREEQHRNYIGGLLMVGHHPRTIAEILDAAAMM